MSSNLCWEPVIEKRHKTMSDATKFLLREIYLFSSANGGLDVTISASDKQYFLGILAATRDEEIKEDINTIIEQIDKHGSIHIWEQY